MDFETNMEQIADQQDAFLEGWDPTDQLEPEEVVEEIAGVETDTEVTEETTEETEEQQPTSEETTETATETEVTPAPVTEWVIKHMGTEQKFTASDITPELLQKGMDYDRVRAKYDEAKPITELFAAFAQKANMSVADYAKYLRTAALKAEGLSDAEAERTVALEDREAAIAIAEAEKQEAAQEQTAQQEKIRADLELFGKLYPDVYKQAESNRDVIPQSVWAAVQKGEPLAVAYKKYADAQAVEKERQLLARVAAAEQGAKNVGRSTGSMKSAGNDTKNTDAFLDGWGS